MFGSFICLRVQIFFGGWGKVFKPSYVCFVRFISLTAYNFFQGGEEDVFKPPYICLIRFICFGIFPFVKIIIVKNCKVCFFFPPPPRKIDSQSNK